ncbi:D-arabinono-1,4-lactone oxidase [Henriciella litoralis]|uniref:D-arabinono-1,4-lactone oxidase n=1 Tax=Henriciella litoralis TaxID=568102 RepID=UPI000A064476|nr:D-arabinono-1,4-lactone oxidase [Henriciella litoralis]
MKISRRNALIGGAGIIGAPVVIGGGQHVAWSGRNFTKDSFDYPEFEAGPGQTVWKNWAANQGAVLSAIKSLQSEEELASIVANAQGGIRPLGSGHSWSGVVPTDGTDGTLIDLGRFVGVYDVDLPARTAVVGAGTRIGQAARLLAEQGLAFPNLPDINQQTLAGAFATATHGTGQELPAMHDSVIGFRMVTANGEILDVTAETNADLFEAGKVSLGALGIITQYTLKLKPRFLLHRRVWLEDIYQLLDRAPEMLEMHPFFEFFYLHNVGKALVIVHNYYDGDPSDVRETPDDDDLLEQLKHLRNELGWWPWMRRRMFNSAFPSDVEIENVKEESWKLLSTPRPTKIFETEYHIPVESGIAAYKEMLKFLDNRKSFYFPSEFRYIGPDNAWLSPFNDGVRNSISFHTPANEDYSLHAEVIEPMMLRHGGRPHWGKVHSLKYEQLKDMYPKFNSFRELRRELDPEGKFLNQHLKSLFGES